MTIKQQGGIFGRNPTFNNVEATDLTTNSVDTANLTTSGTVSLDGPVTINDSGSDVDFRVEGDTDANLIWVDASRDKVGIGHNWAFDKNSKLRVEGPYLSSLSTSSVSAFSASGGGAVSTWIGGVGYSYGYIQAIQDDASMNLKQLWLNPLGGDVRIADGNLIVASGKGIDFSATSDASGSTSELFDDYEEGVFTVTTAGDATGAFSAETGEYTKIGNVVYVRIALLISTNFTSNKIGGLPFTPVIDTGATGLASMGVALTQSTGSAPIIAGYRNGQTDLEMYTSGSQGAAHLPNTTNSYYRFQGFYFV